MAEEETETAASEENTESSGEEASADAEVVEGKFGKAEIVIPDTVQKLRMIPKNIIILLQTKGKR